jgi:hypothetical protein
MPEFHVEPYIYLAGLSHMSALIAWGASRFGRLVLESPHEQSRETHLVGYCGGFYDCGDLADSGGHSVTVPASADRPA